MTNYEKIFEVVKLVVLAASVIVSTIAFIKARASKNAVSAEVEKELQQIKANDLATKKEEGELKEMAKFKCDRCGAVDDVKNAVSFGDFDVCAACGEHLSRLRDNVAEKEIAEQKAAEDLKAAKAELENYLKSESGKVNIK